MDSTNSLYTKPETFLSFLHRSQCVQQKKEPLYPLMKQLDWCLKQSHAGFGPSHWDKRRIVSIYQFKSLINICIIMIIFAGPG